MQDQVLTKNKCDSLQFRAMHTSPVVPANNHRSRNQINVLASPRFPQCWWFIMSGQLTLMLLSGGKYLLLFVSSLHLYRTPSIRQSGSHCSTQDLAHQWDSIHTLTHDSQNRPDVLILVLQLTHTHKLQWILSGHQSDIQIVAFNFFHSSAITLRQCINI